MLNELKNAEDRDSRFWEAYALIEPSLRVKPEDFVRGEAVREGALQGMVRCLLVVREAADELCVKLNRSPGPELEDTLWELGRLGEVKPELLSDALDVYHVVRAAYRGELDPAILYAQIVRIMEVTEACWKHLEERLRLERTK